MRTDLRRLLAPRWLLWHAALIAVLVAFALLGNWQLDGFLDSGDPAAPSAGQAAVPIDDVLEPGARLPRAAVERPVSATGRYDAGARLLVPGRLHDDREGYLVVTPLRTADGVLPVNRGWVASVGDAAAQPPDGEVTVTGVLQPSESEADATVDPFAALPEGQIPYLATVVLLDTLPLDPDELYDGYLALQAEDPAPAVSPEPVEPRAPDDGVGRWRNLGYALQWWFFAGAAVFFWWAVIRRSLREERDQVAEVEPVEPVDAG